MNMEPPNPEKLPGATASSGSEQHHERPKSAPPESGRLGVHSIIGMLGMLVPMLLEMLGKLKEGLPRFLPSRPPFGETDLKRLAECLGRRQILVDKCGDVYRRIARNNRNLPEDRWPRWRGVFNVAWLILTGSTFVGICLMAVVNGGTLVQHALGDDEIYRGLVFAMPILLSPLIYKYAIMGPLAPIRRVIEPLILIAAMVAGILFTINFAEMFPLNPAGEEASLTLSWDEPETAPEAVVEGTPSFTRLFVTQALLEICASYIMAVLFSQLAAPQRHPREVAIEAENNQHKRSLEAIREKIAVLDGEIAALQSRRDQSEELSRLIADFIDKFLRK